MNSIFHCGWQECRVSNSAESVQLAEIRSVASRYFSLADARRHRGTNPASSHWGVISWLAALHLLPPRRTASHKKPRGLFLKQKEWSPRNCCYQSHFPLRFPFLPPPRCSRGIKRTLANIHSDKVTLSITLKSPISSWDSFSAAHLRTEEITNKDLLRDGVIFNILSFTQPPLLRVLPLCPPALCGGCDVRQCATKAWVSGLTDIVVTQSDRASVWRRQTSPSFADLLRNRSLWAPASQPSLSLSVLKTYNYRIHAE